MSQFIIKNKQRTPENTKKKRMENNLIFACNQIYVKFLNDVEISWTTNKMHKIYFMNIFTQ